MSFIRDVRLGARALWQRPLFSVVALATLALGIGANAAIFSVIDAVLLKPLPFRNPDQLVMLWCTESAPGNFPLTGPDYLEFQKDNRTFSGMSLLSWNGSANLSGSGTPERVPSLRTQADFFSLLGVHPLLGRVFAPGEDAAGKDHVALISQQLWQKRFGDARDAIGRPLRINGESYTVIGVMPAWFNLGGAADVWMPLNMAADKLGQRGEHQWRAIGRMKPGVSIAQAQADLRTIAARLAKEFPSNNADETAIVVGLHEQLVGDTRPQLYMMLGAVALVLLIACVNVANLLLGRALSRQREMAIRSALGASRLQLMRQLLTEAVLLAVAGAAAGLLLASAAMKALQQLAFSGPAQPNPIQLDGRVLLFTLGVAVLTGLLFGLAPALQLSRPAVQEELKSGSLTTAGATGRRRLLADGLLVFEIGLSLALLIGAGLLLKSFARLRTTDVGVRSAGVLTAQVTPPPEQYKKAEQLAGLYREYLARLRRLPGVEEAAITGQLPLNGGNNGYVTIPGRAMSSQSGPLVEFTAISDDYFRAMGIPMLRGRAFESGDLERAAALTPQMEAAEKSDKPDAGKGIEFPAVISRAMAEYFWPGENPLGKMFSPFGEGSGPLAQVIGVVGDVREWSLRQASVPEAYFPYTLDRNYGMNIVLRTTVAPMSLAHPMESALAQVDPNLPLFNIKTMDQVIADGAFGTYDLMLLMGIFAGLALVLAAIGIYGVMAWMVGQRTREIGVRVALGADARRVVRMILARGLVIALLGGVLGVAGAAGGGRLIASSLYLVKPYDAGVMTAATVLLLAVAIASCWLPARRASRVNPVDALRAE
jgi:putative ABC transport system permease protein